MAHWIFTQQNKIFTIVQTRLSKKYAKKYPDLRFTTDDEPNSTVTAFPTVLFRWTASPEIGQTIDHSGINGILCGLQVEVTTSKSQGQYEATDLAWTVLTELHDNLLFDMQLSPEVKNTGNDTSKVIFRVKRIIGANDVIK